MCIIERRYVSGLLTERKFISFFSSQAYKNWLKKHKQEEYLPKIGLSHDQLFYLSFAHVMNSRLVMYLSHSPCLNDEIDACLLHYYGSSLSIFNPFSPLFEELDMMDVVGRFSILF